MTKSYRKARIVNKIVIYLILIVMSLFFLFPLFNMVSKSLMTLQESISRPPTLFPERLQWRNYVEVFQKMGTTNGVSYFVVYILNTFQIMLLSIPPMIITTTLVAYGFCKIKFKGRNLVFMILLATMMIPGSVTMVSSYVIWVKLGFYDSNVPLWIGSWFGGGIINVFLVKQFMGTLPIALNESATIDGAGHFRIFFSIILPNCIPIVTTLAVGAFLSTWNDFTNPLIYLKNPWNWTLAIGVSRFGLDGDTGGINYLMAACTLMSILPILFFFFGQKFFIDSIVLDGMKE